MIVSLRIYALSRQEQLEMMIAIAIVTLCVKRKMFKTEQHFGNDFDVRKGRRDGFKRPSPCFDRQEWKATNEIQSAN